MRPRTKRRYTPAARRRVSQRSSARRSKTASGRLRGSVARAARRAPPRSRLRKRTPATQRVLIVAALLIIVGFAALFVITKRRAQEIEGMVLVPAGTYTIGSPAGELGRDDDEAVREVQLGHDLQVMAHEVTIAQWVEWLGQPPPAFEMCGEGCPVVGISWIDAAAVGERGVGSLRVAGVLRDRRRRGRRERDMVGRRVRRLQVADRSRVGDRRQGRITHRVFVRRQRFAFPPRAGRLVGAGGVVPTQQRCLVRVPF